MTSSQGGRRCICCTHEQRDVIDALIAEGMADAAVSRRFSISQDSVRRHRVTHLMEGIEVTATAGPVAIATRLREIADAARVIRVTAANSGNGALALRGGDSEGRALTALKEHLGIDHETVADTLAELPTAYSMLRGIVEVAAEHPRVREAIEAKFRSYRRDDLADEWLACFTNTDMKEITA